MTSLTARSGPRAIIGLMAALGLVAALSMPALASHDTDLELVAPGGQEECEGFDYGWKLDNMGTLSAGTYTASDAGHTVWIEIELFENGESEVNDYTILDEDPEIANVYVKQPVVNGGISHLTFCYDVPDVDESAPASEPVEESEEAEESQAEESQSEESQAAESIGEGVLGGNPTPTGAALPDTAAGAFGQIPATVLSLVLLGALAAMVSVRLARQR